MLFLLTESNYVFLAGVVFAFILTLVLLKVLAAKLPQDKGRAFAVEGQLSKGKARGAGIILIAIFILVDLIFNILSVERTIYLGIIGVTMLSGFLDDASNKPWNEYLKGLIDLILAIGVAVTFLYYNENTIYIAVNDYYPVTLPMWAFGILIVVLVWTAINVTNCTDGVDGLCGSLSIITIGSFYFFMKIWEPEIGDFTFTMVVFIVILLAYLCYNSAPSTILMGDAGSRAIGIFIAIAALKSGSPLMYLAFSLIMLLDGGLGLIKVALLRFLKIKILKKIRCPLHDQARKNMKWSNTQVCFRFAAVQIVISLVLIWLTWINLG